MALATGTRLGVYEIIAPLGAGGMGEVYKARDTRLNRTVAIKVLSENLAADHQFRERFDREARAISQLDHPHICALYDVGDQNGLSFLVMQHLEGETLETRLQRGALPLDDALAVAIQIAGALDVAHRSGIVHRDLKPGNIFLVRSSSGSPSAKLLDFGLAKTDGADTAARTTVLATTPKSLTAQGTILGTFQYMSPEQLDGREADARTDIFAFGAVVYEMVTGRKAFEGKTQASLIAKILESHPQPISALQPATPAALDRLVNKCLTKDPDARWQNAADLATELQWLRDSVSIADSTGSAVRASRMSFVVIGLAVVASTLAAIAGVGWWRATRHVDRPMMRMSAELLPAPKLRGSAPGEIDGTLLFNSVPGTSLALTPDGTRLVTTVLGADNLQRLAVRRLDQDRFEPLPGTEGGTGPFVSPDGQSIAFFAEGKLRRISIEGGTPVALCDSNNSASGSWVDNESIVAALGAGSLSLVPSAGGAPAPLTKLEPGETGVDRPEALPDGDSVLFTVRGGGDGPRIDVVSIRTHERKTVLRGGEFGRYVSSSAGDGYIVYVGGQSLFAVPFHLGSRAVTGQPKRILDDVSSMHSTRGDFEVSRSGTFVYMSGPREPERSIFWLDGAGKTELLHAERGQYSGLRFSPDGTRLVFVKARDPRGNDLWVRDLRRGNVERLTSQGGNSPIWSPDGTHILFTKGSEGLAWIRSDGVGEPQILEKVPGTRFPESFSPDGKLITFISGNPFTAMAVVVAPLEGLPDHPRLGKVEPIASTPGFPMGVFSPDGHWIAYASADAGKAQIYVQPYPGPGGKVAVSIDGGTFPQWSPNGRELFFLDSDQRITVADYTITAGRFVPGRPREWSPHQVLLTTGGGPFQPFALAPDGKRFAVMLYPDGTTEYRRRLHLTFLLNFADELHRQFAAK